MTQHDHVEESFSEFFDGSLEESEHDSVQAHLRECSACREGYLAFERSTQALRDLRLAPTSAAHVRDVMAAVAPAKAPPRTRWALALPLLSHAAALLVGLGIAWSLSGWDRGSRQANDEGPSVVEVVREVRVEVPVEVVREVVLERPVEHIVYVDRPVPNPLQLDAERAFRLLAGFGGALTELARVAGEESARREAPVFDPLSNAVLAHAPEHSRLAPAVSRPQEQRVDPSAPLRILRTGDRVRIQTRGSLDDVVPALIDTLYDPDAAVVRAAEHHLEALRADFEGETAVSLPESRARVPMADLPGGLRGLLASNRSQPDEAAAVDPHARWTTWWLERSTAGGGAESFNSSPFGNPRRAHLVTNGTMRFSLTALLSAALLSGCVVTSGSSAKNPSAFLLSERTSEDGVQTRFRVQPSRKAGPSIVRIETRSQQVAYLGLNVRSLDRPSAQALGLEPWRGVRVTGVSGDSAAKAAGLQVGDVLLSLSGEEITSMQQFQESVAVLLAPGVPTSGKRLRKSPSGEFVEDTFEVTPGSRKIDDSVTEHFALEAPDEIVQRTGMQVATIDAELARETGMGDSSLALVTSVIAGASAYDEGIRGGDRILECNGLPVARAEDVIQALESGASRLEVLVDGPLGEHRASLETDEDVDARRRFHIPIIVEHSRRIDSTRTSFLDFIFQFGYNYRRTVSDSPTREPFVESYLSLFPLGMFEFERSPEKSRNTLFWLISWSTRR